MAEWDVRLQGVVLFMQVQTLVSHKQISTRLRQPVHHIPAYVPIHAHAPGGISGRVFTSPQGVELNPGSIARPNIRVALIDG